MNVNNGNAENDEIKQTSSDSSVIFSFFPGAIVASVFLETFLFRVIVFSRETRSIEQTLRVAWCLKRVERSFRRILPVSCPSRVRVMLLTMIYTRPCVLAARRYFGSEQAIIVGECRLEASDFPSMTMKTCFNARTVRCIKMIVV